MSTLIPKNPFLSGIPTLLGMAPRGNSCLKFLVSKEPHESGLASSHSIEPLLWKLTPPSYKDTDLPTLSLYLLSFWGRCCCSHVLSPETTWVNLQLWLTVPGPMRTTTWNALRELLHHMHLLPPQLPTSRRLPLAHKCFSLHALWWDSSEPHITWLLRGIQHRFSKNNQRTY